VFRNPAGESAGRLIDEAGLKGLRIGGAVVSEKHANFIVNDQKGTAADVRRLAERVHAEILTRHGFDLRFEIEFVGDWAGWEVAA
jgi:UDP-N-acetylmuramate dehydrogenase